MKALFMPFFISLIALLSFFENNNSNLKHSEVIKFSNLDSANLIGNKSFNEVRIVRRKLIVKVFTDVITKYQQKDTSSPTDIDGVEKEIAANNPINLIIYKYSI